MSGIFDLFGGTLEMTKRAPTLLESVSPSKKPVLRPGGPGGGTRKIFGAAGGKPKGLSVRSYSDLNIGPTSPRPSGAKKDLKRLDLLKPTQLDTSGRPISPRSRDKVLKAQNLKPISMKALSPKMKSPSSIPTSKLSEQNIFKKPLPPRETNRKGPTYPVPEVLSYFYNDEEQVYHDIYERTLEEGNEKLISAMTSSLKIYEDEGFESDPEFLPTPIRPVIKSFSGISDDELGKECSFDLPEISDDEF